MADEVLSLEWNINQFTAFLNEFSNNVDIEAGTFLKKMALDLLSRILKRMPVATGRARAGWSAAGNALGVDVPDALTSQPGDSKYEEQLDGNTKIIRMTNNVEYVIYLEYGSSKQAPLGMLRVSMLELQAGQSTAIADMEQGLKDMWDGLRPAQRYEQQGISISTLHAKIPTGRLANTLNAVRAARSRNV